MCTQRGHKREHLGLEHGRMDRTSRLMNHRRAGRGNGMPESRVYPWSRFWYPRGTSLNVDGDGYPYDPEDRYGKARQPAAVGADAVLTTRCVVLLGEAGSGKTQSVSSLASSRSSGDADESVAMHRLGEFGSVDAIDREVFHAEEFLASQSGGRALALFLDGLDEALVGVDNLVGLLQRRLRGINTDRLLCVFACRAAMWPETLTASLHDAFGQDHVSILQIAPLRRSEIEVACAAESIDSDEFFCALDDSAAHPLARIPLTLTLLLRAFREDRTLPKRRAILFARTLPQLCDTTPERRDRGTGGELTAAQRIEIASRVAVMCLLSGADRLALQHNASSSSSVLLDDVLGEEEGEGASRVEVSRAAVIETVASGVFTAAGAEEAGFAHRSFAEFLAARYLFQLGLSDVEYRRVFVTDDESKAHIVPQLWEVAGWLADLSTDFYQMLLTAEPELLLISDAGQLSDLAHRQLVEAYLTRVEEGSLSYLQLQNFEAFYGRLAYPGLAEQLRSVICDTSRNDTVRSTAVEIAQQCQLHGTASVIADIALCHDADHYLRKTAGYAILHLAVPEASAKLRPLVVGDAGDDPYDDLLGLGLRATWPANLSAEELFVALRPPKKSNYGGAYSGFLHEADIVSRLDDGELQFALEWAARNSRRDMGGDRARLAGEVVRRAWDSIDAPGVCSSLAKAIIVRCEINAPMCYIEATPDETRLPRNDVAAIKTLIETHEETRRRVVSAIVELTENDRQFQHCLYGATPLICAEDFEWLVELAAEAPSSRSRWARSARAAFDRQDQRHVEVWLSARTRSSEIMKAMNWATELQLNSREARIAKRDYLYEQRRRNRAETKPRLTPPLSERVNTVAERCVTEEPLAFWYLAREMSLEDDSTHYYDRYHASLRESPGWKNASDGTRLLICRAAALLLADGALDVDDLEGRDDRYTSDEAPAQALLLLVHEDRDAIDAIPSDRWPVIAAFTMKTLVCGFGVSDADNQHICDLLATKVPEKVESMLVAALRACQPDATHLADPIRRVASVAGDGLRQEMLDRLASDAWNPRLWGELLAVALEANMTGAREVGLDTVSRHESCEEDGDRSVVAAVALAYGTADATWSELWPIVESNPRFGRLVVQKIAYGTRFAREEALHLKLQEGAIAELYEWIFGQYQPATDRQFGTGGYTPDEDDAVRRWRHGLEQYLIQSGTDEACGVFSRMKDEYPEYPYLRDILRDAEHARRRSRWQPMTIEQLRALVSMAKQRRLASVATIDQMLRVVVRAIGSEASESPRLFTLLPEQTRWFDPRGLWSRGYRLTLWCEHAEAAHPCCSIGSNGPGEYVFRRSRAWLRAVSPVVFVLARVLKAVVPVVGAAGDVMVDERNWKDIAKRLSLMESMAAAVSAVPEQSADIASPGGQLLSSAEGDAYRAIRKLLNELDAAQGWGGLQRILSASGEFVWMCPEHAASA